MFERVHSESSILSCLEAFAACWSLLEVEIFERVRSESLILSCLQAFAACSCKVSRAESFLRIHQSRLEFCDIESTRGTFDCGSLLQGSNADAFRSAYRCVCAHQHRLSMIGSDIAQSRNTPSCIGGIASFQSCHKHNIQRYSYRL